MTLPGPYWGEQLLKVSPIISTHLASGYHIKKDSRICLAYPATKRGLTARNGHGLKLPNIHGGLQLQHTSGNSPRGWTSMPGDCKKRREDVHILPLGFYAHHFTGKYTGSCVWYQVGIARMLFLAEHQQVVSESSACSSITTRTVLCLSELRPHTLLFVGCILIFQGITWVQVDDCAYTLFW